MIRAKERTRNNYPIISHSLFPLPFLTVREMRVLAFDGRNISSIPIDEPMAQAINKEAIKPDLRAIAIK